MTASVDTEFLKLINSNLGIAHKVARIYFDDVTAREDVIQEMMYQLWKSFKGFDGQSKFSTWMYSVCLNTALTYRRKTKKHTRETLDTQHYNIADQSTDAKDEDLKLLFQAVSTLTQLNKAIILLYLEDMTYDEIATVTGLTKTNVSVKLVRIKKELEAYIKKQSKTLRSYGKAR